MRKLSRWNSVLLISGLLYTAGFFAIGCGLKPNFGNGTGDDATQNSQPSDIAGWSPDFQLNISALFYYEGGRFFRARCQPRAVLFDRSTCSEAIADVPAPMLMNDFRAERSQKLPGLDTRFGQLSARLERVERRQLELVLANPTPADPNLLTRIEEMVSARSSAEATLATLKDQYARIEGELRQSPDPDLQKQLLIIQEQITASNAQIAGLTSELGSLRQQFVRANASLIDPAVYRELEQERQHVVQELDHTNGQRRVVMDEMLMGEQVLMRIMDGGYTYDFNLDTPTVAPMKPIYNRFAEKFAALDEFVRNFTPDIDTRAAVVRVKVGRQGFLGKMLCQLTTVPEMGCDTTILTSPDGTSFEFPGRDGFAFNYPDVCEGSSCSLFLKEAQGDWTIKPVCRMSGVGSTSPLRGVNQNWNCAITVRNWSDRQ